MARTFCQGLLRIVAAVLIGGAGPASAADRPLGRPQRVNPDAQLSAEFNTRIESYLELHKQAEAELPARSRSATPAEIDTHERALARRITQARRNARQGDIFAQDIRAYFRRQLARALAGPDGGEIRQALSEENPGRVQVRINTRYPETLPMSTVPPQVLAALPKLPEELEYRFIASRLILLDAHAQLVVDYMDDAIPR